LPWDVLSL